MHTSLAFRLRRASPALILLVLIAGISPAYTDDLRLDLLGDSLALGGGLSLAGASEILFRTLPAPDLGAADMVRINGVDRLAVFGYSKGFDIASDVLQYATIAVPAAFALFLSLDQSAAIGVVYLETLSYAYFVKDILKCLLPRQRPWLYRVDTSGPGPQDEPSYDSFPSGHTTMAFAAAAFGVFVFGAYFPGSPYLIPFAIADYGLAALTASFRIFSGMHFITDVIAGSLIGVTCGLLVPYLHLSSLSGTPQARALFPPVEVPLVTLRL